MRINHPGKSSVFNEITNIFQIIQFNSNNNIKKTHTFLGLKMKLAIN